MSNPDRYRTIDQGYKIVGPLEIHLCWQTMPHHITSSKDCHIVTVNGVTIYAGTRRTTAADKYQAAWATVKALAKDWNQ